MEALSVSASAFQPTFETRKGIGLAARPAEEAASAVEESHCIPAKSEGNHCWYAEHRRTAPLLGRQWLTHVMKRALAAGFVTVFRVWHGWEQQMPASLTLAWSLQSTAAPVTDQSNVPASLAQ